MNIIGAIKSLLTNSTVTTTVLLATLLVITMLSIYELLVYVFVSKGDLSNRSISLSLLITPYFIATIILCLQQNSVITLGTIGALAIIRFRTAIKNPSDMVYLLWSIHNGIMVGCGMFKVAIVTSIVVTIVMFIFNIKPLLNYGKNTYTLLIRTSGLEDDEVLNFVKGFSKIIEVVSRKSVDQEIDYVLNIKCSDVNSALNLIKENKNITKFQIMSNNGDGIK